MNYGLCEANVIQDHILMTLEITYLFAKLQVFTNVIKIGCGLKFTYKFQVHTEILKTLCLKPIFARFSYIQIHCSHMHSSPLRSVWKKGS